MIYSDFQNSKLPLLGFGAMRLPELPGGGIDEAQVEKMVAVCMEQGVNYFDTAYPYHEGNSERVMGRILSKYPRESFCLASKFPGHMVMKSYDPAKIFEEQLQKCQVEYFDFYLLHNVSESSMATYLDPKWGILDYLREQKRLGRIRHLGFSTHARISGLEQILDLCGEDMEFCQIQLNYLDWSLQNAKRKYEILTERGIPVWVMEPVRGGRLANFEDAAMKALRPEESIAAWGFRFLQGLDNVHMILSGMSNMEQLQENIATFAQRKPLNERELEAAFTAADCMKDAVPCTACRYCCDGCPMGLDIPMMMGVCSELRFADSLNSAMILQFTSQDKQPSACIACGKCTKVCPQGIDIPGIMKELTERLQKLPKWVDVCKLREQEQERSRQAAGK